LMQGAADLWTVSDPVNPADAVAILGGRPELRALTAAAYYRNRITAKILVAETQPSALEILGIAGSHADLNRAILANSGIPEAAIEIYGVGVANTYEEAVALRNWAIRARARRIIVPTEKFSARRVRWVMNHVFAGAGTQVQVPAVIEPEYEEWWKTEKGLLAFQNEIIKYIYYRIKY